MILLGFLLFSAWGCAFKLVGVVKMNALTKKLYELRGRAEYVERTYLVQSQSDSQTQCNEKRVKRAEASGIEQRNEARRKLADYNALKEDISRAQGFLALALSNLKGNGVLLQARVADLADAKFCCVENGLDDCEVKPFAYELEAMLQEEFLEPVIEKVKLADSTSDKKCCSEATSVSIDNLRGETTSLSTRLKSLHVLLMSSRNIDLPENAESLFTSKMANRGVDLELGILSLVTEEFRRTSTYEQKLRQLKKDRVVSTRKLVAKLRTDVMKLQQKFSAESLSALASEMSSRMAMLKSVRRSDDDISALTKFLSLGITKIAEEVYKDALQERDLQHARAKENQDQQHAREKESHDLKLETAIAKLAEQKSKVAFLSTELKVHKEATSNEPECCICYRELEGYSTGQDASSSTRKVVHKRACFLPCMHANVCKACSEKRWSEGPQVCPMCRHKLTSKPRLIYL